MDHQTFDRLTRLVGTAASRRTAWRALLGAALLGTTSRSAAAEQCANDKPACGNDGCCPGRCFDFVSDSGGSSGSSDVCKVCCTKENNRVICRGDQGYKCCNAVDKDGTLLKDPCQSCPLPSPGNDCPNVSGIAGSYRRR